MGLFYLCTFFATVSSFRTSPVHDRLWSPETSQQTTKLPQGYEYSINTRESTASKFINNMNIWNLGQCVPGVGNWWLCLEILKKKKKIKSYDCVRVSCFRDWSMMKCEHFSQVSDFAFQPASWIRLKSYSWGEESPLSASRVKMRYMLTAESSDQPNPVTRCALPPSLGWLFWWYWELAYSTYGNQHPLSDTFIIFVQPPAACVIHLTVDGVLR